MKVPSDQRSRFRPERSNKDRVLGGVVVAGVSGQPLNAGVLNIHRSSEVLELSLFDGRAGRGAIVPNDTIAQGELRLASGKTSAERRRVCADGCVDNQRSPAPGVDAAA